MSILLELIRYIPGCLFFPSVFVYGRRYFRRRFQNEIPKKFKDKEEVEGVATAVAMRLGSCCNATFMIIVGLISVCTTGKDIHNDRSPVLVPYCYMGIPYMVYDIYAMLLTYQTEKPSRKNLTLFQLFKGYFLESPMITTHHTMVGVLLYPLVLYYLNGKGDFILGIFFLSECSTPFLSFRFIMKKTKANMPTVFLLNDILILIVFFCCRILMIPVSYWLYGRNVGLTFVEVPYNIPMMCNILNALILSMQLVWFVMIIQAASRFVMKYTGKAKLKNRESNGKAAGHIEEVNSNHMQQKVD